MYVVKVKKKVVKNVKKLPEKIQLLFGALLEDLANIGPEQQQWKNYSQLGENKYHCHLGYHYCACWSYEQGTIEIEVYYAGSREGAPY